MSVFVKLNMIKYWAHLETLPKERLVKMVYEHAKNNNYSVWYSSVKHTLANLQIDISTIKLTDSLSKRAFIKGVEKKLKDKSKDQWKTKIVTSSNPKFNCKLRTYNLFKTDFKMESYITKTENFQKKQYFSKLRLSNHRLEIESGRYKNIKAESRLCNQCNHPDKPVEDELHFIINCPKYNKERQSLFSKLQENNQSFDKLNDSEKFKYIMTCEENINDINTLFHRRLLKYEISRGK